MQVPDIIIAIDGFSATGKSTLAKLIAETFSFLYLDSGALYRGVTLFAQENGYIDPDNTIHEAELKAALDAGLDLHFGLDGTYIGDRRIEKEIRTMEVSSQVSPIAAVPFVRAFVDGKLHEAGAKGRVVMDGRDIGTVVLPDAKVKIYLTASSAVRAKRRYDELTAKGEKCDLAEIEADIIERDERDMNREIAPLKQADDAVLVDTSDMGIDEVHWRLLDIVNERIG